MAPYEARIMATTIRIVTWLVDGDYAEIENYTNGIRLSAALLEKAISEYGRTLIMPPDSALDHLDIVEVDASCPKKWSVRVDLWTAEEGRSDLSLECTMIDQPGDFLCVEVDNLHVP